MQAAKQAGKKLGRPKGGKIKGEDMVIELYKARFQDRGHWNNYLNIAELAGVSISTVQRIINKYREDDKA